MMQSFDWIPKATKDNSLKQKILKNMDSDNQIVVLDRYRFSFNQTSETVRITRISPDAVKIWPVTIPYSTLTRILDGEWPCLEGVIVE